MPGKENLEAIFSRFGINPDSFASIYLDEGVAATEKMKAELDHHLAHGNAGEAGELINHDEMMLVDGGVSRNFVASVGWVFLAFGAVSFIAGVAMGLM